MKKVFLLLFYFLTFSIWAGTEKYNSRLSCSAISGTSAFFSVQDAQYNYMSSSGTGWQSLFYNKSIKNRVVLGIDHANTTFLPSYTLLVNVSVTYYSFSGSAFAPTTISKTLSVSNYATGTWNDKSVFEIPAGGNLVNVQVNSITGLPTGYTANQLNFYVEAEVEVERYYNFAPTVAIPSNNVVCNTNYLTSTGELEISWATTQGAESYDMEWLYINDYNVSTGSYITPSSIPVDDRLFQFNSTRINTTNTYYRLPYVYDHGYLVFRVRAVGKTSVDNYVSYVYSPWSSEINSSTTDLGSYLTSLGTSSVSGLNTYFSSTAFSNYVHQDNLNYQASITYAEEGKSKAVVNYFDGSLRNRQSVTKIKTDNDVIVGETFYDYQGRASVTALPAPMNNSKIEFKPYFNQDPSGNPYDKIDFDTDGGTCGENVNPMVNTSGASKYYSPNSDFIQSGQPAYIQQQQSYVPDAQLYPFTHTEYTPDNTGRIRRQGGVGPQFQLGSLHETKYFYGQPEQEELDQLFGSEAGYSNRYKKTMTEDPNGQISVTYIDPAGKTVATALAGQPPTNVQPLQSAGTNTMVIDLLNKTNPANPFDLGQNNDVDLNAGTITISKQILVESAQSRSFEYDLTMPTFTNTCNVSLTDPTTSVTTTSTNNICYSCVADLTISLTDECGNEYLLGVGTNSSGQSIVTTTVGQNILNNFISSQTVTPQVPAPDANLCAASSTYSNLTFNKGNACSSGDSWVTSSSAGPLLQPGNYTLTKIVKIDEQALEDYSQQYLDTNYNKCLLKYSDFLAQELGAIDLSGCGISCATCVANLGPYSNYDANNPNIKCDPCLTQAQYQDLIDQCNEMCDPKSDKCNAAYQSMLADMSPMGQYGQVMPGGSSVNGNIQPPQINSINPNVFPLSVFNSYNLLPYKSQINAAYNADLASVYGGSVNSVSTFGPYSFNGINSWLPNWRFPYNPTYTGINAISYLDDNGNPALVKITPLSTPGTYTPAILANGMSQVIQTVSGVQYIPPQYLAHVADFIANWHASWAGALAEYHPEACSYDFCNNINLSNDFDEALIDFQVTSDGSMASDLNAPPIGGITNIMSASTLLALDPYFSTTTNPTVYTSTTLLNADLALMTDALTNYAPDPANPTHYISIWDFVYREVNFPNATNSPPCSAVTPLGFTTISTTPLVIQYNNFTKKQEWEMFKSLYMSLKQTLVERYSIKYSIDHGCYNGCVSNNNFNPFLNNFFNSFYVGTGWFWPNWWSCIFSWPVTGCPTPTSVDISQYYNPEQPCKYSTAYLYKNMVPRFATNTQGMQMGGVITGEVNACGATIYGTPLSCPASNASIANDAANAAANSLYAQCGQCPNDVSLQSLIKGLTTINSFTAQTTNDLLDPTNTTTLTCYPAPGSFHSEYTPQLDVALWGSSFTSPVTWKYNNPSNSHNDVTKIIYGALQNGSSTCNIALAFSNVASNSTYTSTTTTSTLTPVIGNYSFADIVDLCCLKQNNTISGSSYLYLSPGYVSTNHNFSFIAKVLVRPDDPWYSGLVGQTKDVQMEGYISCMTIGTCTLNPTCQKSSGAQELENLWNVLLYSNSSVSPAVTQVFTNSTTSPGVVLNNMPYQALLTQDLQTQIFQSLANSTTMLPLPTDTWYWKVDGVSGNTMNAHINSSNASIASQQCNFVFTFTTSGYTFANTTIISIANIGPDPNNAPNGFIANALVQQGTNPATYIDLVGSCSCLSMGQCSTQPSVTTGSSINTLQQVDINSCSIDVGEQGNFSKLLAGLSSSNTLQPFYSYSGGSGTTCGVYFNIPPGSVYTYTDVVAVANYQVDASHLNSNGTSNYFTATATLQNGDNATIWGYDNCHTVGTCGCTGPSVNNIENFEEFSNPATIPTFTTNTPIYPVNTNVLGSTPYAGASVSQISAWPNTLGWTGDHTIGTSLGYALFFKDINDTNYRQFATTYSVSSNATYTFGAWFSHVLYDIAIVEGHPSVVIPVSQQFPVRFSIDVYVPTSPGVYNITTHTFVTGGTNCTWENKNFTFTNSAYSGPIGIVIRCSSTTLPAGLGIGLDDISFTGGCGSPPQPPPGGLCNVPEFPQISPDPNPCMTSMLELAAADAMQNYQNYINQQRAIFKDAYLSQCLKIQEQFCMKYIDAEHHFTLYYYDQAGNLVRTVPPQGVVKITDPAQMAQIKVDRNAGTRTVFTNHSYATTYLYNSLNQLVSQTMPDHQNMNIFNIGNANNGINTGYNVNSVGFSSSSNGMSFATDPGGQGHIYTTSNGGSTWSEINALGIGNLNDVTFDQSNPATAYAIGDHGIVLKTTNSGTLWNIATSPATSNLEKIVSASSGLYVFDANGNTYKSTDGAVTWSAALSPSLNAQLGSNILASIAYDGTKAIAASTSGKIYTSIDLQNWSQQLSLTSVTQNKVVNDALNNKYSVGLDGTILANTTGSYWNEIYNNLTNDLKNVVFVSATHAFALDVLGNLWESTNTAQSWTQLSSPTSVKDIYYDAVKNIAYATTGTQVYSYASGSWTTYGNAISSAINTSFVYEPTSGTSVGFVAGNSGLLELKPNSSSSWNVVTVTSPSSFTENISKLYIQSFSTSLSNYIYSGWALTTTNNLYSVTINYNATVTPTYEATLTLAQAGINDFTFYNVGTSSALYAVSNNNLYSYNGTSWSGPISISSGSIVLNSIDVDNSGNLTAVGNNGEIWTSPPGGSSWASNTTNIIVPSLSGVGIDNSSNAYVVGNDGTIISGAMSVVGSSVSVPLTTQITKSNLSLNAVAALSGNVVAVGNAGGYIYGTGGTYTSYTATPTLNLNDVVFSGANAYAAGDDASVLQINGATSSVSNAASGTDNFSAIAASSAGTLFSVGHAGDIYYDAGSSWAAENTLVPPVINGSSVHGTVGYAVGNSGSIIYTSTSGTTWTEQVSNVTSNLRAVYSFASNPQKAIAVGDGGTVLTTTNGGNTWTTLATLSGSGNLTDVQFDATETLGIIVSDNGHVYTVNNNLITVPTSISITGCSTTQYNDVDIASPTLAFLAGNNGVLVKITFNGGTPTAQCLTKAGVDWITYLTNATANINDIYFVDQTTGYAVCNSGIMIRTINAGASWELINASGTSTGSNNLTTITSSGGGNIYVGGTTNTLVQIQDMTDDWSGLFYYDPVGRLVISQNSKQYTLGPNVYSYTLYDPLGRINEVGQIAATTSIRSILVNGQVPASSYNTSSPSAFDTWLSGGARTEVTKTLYDIPSTTFITQENLRNRVSSTYFSQVYGTTDRASHYSYDIHGNVKTLIQEEVAFASLSVSQQYKRIDYDYDLISGKVNQVIYQSGQPDEYHQRYEYDADNKITNIYTSGDSVAWEQDAKYFYYKHGPIARVEIGDLKVQAMDYAHTLQGWIKGVNSIALKTANDIGQDGPALGTNQLHERIPTDEMGYSLLYFTGDYTPVNSSVTANNFLASVTGSYFENARTQGISTNQGLYNGNISGMITSINTFSDNTTYHGGATEARAFGYDQLNRLVYTAFDGSYNAATNSLATSGAGFVTTASVAPTGDFEEKFTYDDNGNILNATRNAYALSGSNQMDNLTYDYETAANGFTKNTNKLKAAIDGITATTYSIDLQAGQVFDNSTSHTADNYQYDELGQLIKDNQGFISNIKWTVYGKVQSITFVPGNGKSNVDFKYDASHNRIMKIEHQPTGDKTTYYVRDGQGNTLATYEYLVPTSGASSFTLKENNIYGSSRLGVHNRNLDLFTTVNTGGIYMRDLANKNYEMVNHLGNVLDVVTGIRIPVASTVTTTQIDHYRTNVVGAIDYYAFGAPMPGRNFTSANYNYGFDGMEKDDGSCSCQAHYTTINREYDARLGRWWSMDPKANKFPDQTPYNNNLNNPAFNKDPNGDCPICIPLIIGAVAFVADVLTQATIITAVHKASDPSYEFEQSFSEVDYFDAAVTGLLATVTEGASSSSTIELNSSKTLIRTVTKLAVQGEFLKASIDVNGSGVHSIVTDKSGSDFSFDLVFGVAGNEVSSMAVDGIRSAVNSDIRQIKRLNNVKPADVMEFQRKVDIVNSAPFELGAGYPASGAGGAASSASKDAYNEATNGSSGNNSGAGTGAGADPPSQKLFILNIGNMKVKAGQTERDKTYVAPSPSVVLPKEK